MPLLIIFQSFTTPVLKSGHSGGSCFMPLSIFSHLPHFCCRHGDSRVSWFMPISILFQSFPTHVLYAGGSGGSCVMPLSIMFHSFTTPVLLSVHSGGSCFMPLSIFGHLPHFCCRQGIQGSHGLCHFQYCFSHLPHV
jgi:hypothetical protein